MKSRNAGNTMIKIDYLSQKAQSAYFAEKLAEAEHEAVKPNAVWLDENEFWSEGDNTQSLISPNTSP